MKASAALSGRRGHGGRRWVTVLALLAFALQSLMVQTHFHAAVSQPASAQTATAHMPAAPLRSQAPVDQCRLCQELMHAGAFVTPSASSVLASLAFTLAVFTAVPSAIVSLATAFAWQSRAPPRR
jgi:hypothetical protein